jgi:hypothetical protein
MMDDDLVEAADGWSAERYRRDRAAAYDEGRRAGCEEGRRAGAAEVMESMRQCVLHIARENVGAVTLAHEQAVRALNDRRALAKLLLGVTGVSTPGELDVLLAQVTSVAGARRGLEKRMKLGYQYQSDFARSYVAEGRLLACDDMRRATIELARSKAPGVDSILLERIEQVDEIPRLVKLIAALGAAQTRDAVEAVLEALPRFT